MNDLITWSYLISLTQLVVRVLYNTLVIVRGYYNTQPYNTQFTTF